MKIPRGKGVIFMAVLALLISGVGFAQDAVLGLVLLGDDLNHPMNNVVIKLFNSQDLLIAIETTDSSGTYSFDSVASGQYYLLASTDQEAEQVNIQDAYYLLMHLLGYYEFNEMEYAAGDVDTTGNVNWGDYFFVVINHLLFEEEFPAGDWVFEDIEIVLSARSSEQEPDTM